MTPGLVPGICCALKKLIGKTLRQMAITISGKSAASVITSTSVALLLAGSVFAAEKNNSVNSLLDVTGVTAQVQSLKNLVAESSKANTRRCNSQPGNHNLPSFSAESILFDIESEFDRLSPSSLEPIVRWYQSPLAEKIHNVEKAVVEYNRLGDFLQTELYTDPIRKTLIQKIVQNTYTAEFVATVGTEVEYAGIAHSGCIEKAVLPGKANREQMLANFTRNDKDLTAKLLMSDITAETAYLFRDLTTDELTRYEAYTSGDNARQFYQNLITAVHYGLKRAGDRVSLAHNTNRSTPEL